MRQSLKQAFAAAWHCIVKAGIIASKMSPEQSPHRTWGEYDPNLWELHLSTQKLSCPSYHHDALFIDGRWVAPATRERITVRSPSSEEIVGEVPSASPADVDAAVKAARNAFDNTDWPNLPMVERARFVSAMADEIERRMEDFATINTLESGQPREKNSKAQLGIVLMNYRYYADMAQTYQVEERREGLVTPFIVRKEPVGVAGIITPWNAPMVIASFAIPPALIAGCTVVLKTAPESPIHGQLLAEVAEAVGLPAGVLNILPADREASEALVVHPGVDKISFTGSTATGRKVAALCGENLKRFSLELGGKSAAIVLDDANLDEVMPWIVATSTMNSCEACVGQTRILIPRGRHDEFVEKFAAGLGSLKMGDPADPETDMGPLIAERQRTRVESYIEAGREEGADLVLGGGRLASMNTGWFVEPTLFANVKNDMKIAQEEIFGPVLCVIPYEGDDEAVRMANDSEYGLSGTVWTADQERGISIARRVRTGNYGVNVFNMDAAAPFGGFKTSGMGRALGPNGLESFMEIKSIHLPPA
jgi:betaine-aldehyde dehydrogenase